MKSTIFTDAELEAMDNRLKGIGKDPSGIFSQRIRPKIIEILSIWFKEKPALKELIKPMKRGPRGFMSKSIVYSQSRLNCHIKVNGKEEQYIQYFQNKLRGNINWNISDSVFIAEL